MPWRTNGDYYNFKEDSITLHAPAASGVYGLFNFRHQILIGSAANIRDAVMHHRRHTKFRFSRFKPTGFTFEIYPPELRETRAQALIKEYNLISAPQTRIGLAILWHSLRAPEARAFHTEVNADEQPANINVVPITEKLPKPKSKAPWQVGRERFGRAGALCGVIFLAVGIIGLLPYLKNIFHTIVRNPAATAEFGRPLGGSNVPLARAPEPVSDSITERLDVSSAPAVGQAPVSEKPNPDATTGAAPVQPVAAALLDPTTTVNAPTGGAEKSAKREKPASAWSVQAMATTDKQLASDWSNKLKTKGYEAFVVDANISGKTWYRVRIGNFDTRQNAESLRTALRTKEGFRDAFVANNDKPETTIALSRR